MSVFKRKRYSNGNHASFSDINRLQRQLDGLNSDCKILQWHLNSIDASFRDLKTEFENLTDLCAKAIMKDKEEHKKT